MIPGCKCIFHYIFLYCISLGKFSMVPLTFYAYSKIVQKTNKLLPASLNTLGDHIRKKRIEETRMQQDVAKILGVWEDAITYWETNRSHPQIRYYSAIISFLGYYPFDHETESFAGKVKKLRYTKGYSYKQLGAALEVNGSTIRAWELAKNTPTGSQIVEIKIQALLY